MKINLKNLIIIGLFALIFAACDKNRVYDSSKSIENEQWHYQKFLKFDVSIDDTINLHKFFINIRNNNEYEYQNIYLFLTTKLPDGKKSQDTLLCYLADEKGKWLGTGLGDIKDSKLLLKDNLRFPQKGTYSFTLTQAMRKDIINGIVDIGIRIEKQE